MRLATICLLCLLLSGCGQRFVGAAYRVNVGRQVTEVFQDTATTWGAAAEFRFDVQR